MVLIRDGTADSGGEDAASGRHPGGCVRLGVLPARVITLHARAAQKGDAGSTTKS